MSGLGVPETFNSAATPNWKILLHGANHLDEENFSQIFWDFFLSGLNSTKRKYYFWPFVRIIFYIFILVLYSISLGFISIFVSISNLKTILSWKRNKT